MQKGDGEEEREETTEDRGNWSRVNKLNAGKGYELYPVSVKGKRRIASSDKVNKMICEKSAGYTVCPVTVTGTFFCKRQLTA